jgi:hypothetical protein
MKKLLQFLLTAFIIIVLPSQTQAPKPGNNLIAILPVDIWQKVIYVMDKSTAEHNIVLEVKEALLKQLNDSTLQSKSK